MGLKAFVSTVPFSAVDQGPIEILQDNAIEVAVNPLLRRLSETELIDLIGDADILIAGTEPITEAVLQGAERLKLIARVGIGLDNVDLVGARNHGIAVTYTPDAPAPAVAELTLGHILSIIRYSHVANMRMHEGEWERRFGRRIADLTVGVMGAGRIGGRVIQFLSGIGCGRILVNDVDERKLNSLDVDIVRVSKGEMLVQSDVLTLHVPLTKGTRNLIGHQEIFGMKQGSFVVNTSRGGVLDEEALREGLVSEHLAGAAIDVFSEEPYQGPLCSVDNCLLTCHMGSMAQDCRARMEMEAALEAVRFSQGEPFANLVPDTEYEL